VFVFFGFELFDRLICLIIGMVFIIAVPGK
jgi:hypothetical protein